jgi:hypothetical protein
MARASELEALERSGWDALCGPHGAAFYDEVMAEDGLMVFPGLIMDKGATLDAIRKEPPWSTFELTDVHSTATNEVGLVTYKAVAQRSGQSPYVAMMSTVYIRRGADWRLLLHQQSP